MPIPKRKRTKSKRNKIRANIFLKPPVLVSCQKCKQVTIPHVVCINCGYYKGVEVIDVLRKLNKKERREKEKEIKTKGKKGSDKKEVS